MGMRVEEILSLIEPGSLTSGRALFHRQQAKKPRSDISGAQRRFLDEVASASSKEVRVPVHPETAAVREQYGRDRDADLEAVELAWLQRLPLDPAEVTFEDAARLAALANSVDSMKAPASARLIDSVWGPVKALHDRRVAEAQLAAARQSLPSLPASAHAALTDALVEKHGASSEAMALEASQLLEKVRNRREAERARKLERVEKALKAIRDADEARTAKTREVIG